MKSPIIYLAVGSQIVISLVMILMDLFKVYQDSLFRDHNMVTGSVSTLDLIVFLFIPLATLIGTILYFLIVKNRNKIASYLVILNGLGAIAFIIWYFKFISQGSWAVLVAPVIIIVLPIYVLPTFIWGYVMGKTFPK